MSINSSSITVFVPDTATINIVDEEIVYHWNANKFVVYLIKKPDSLKYKIIDRDQKEIYTNCIEIPKSKTLEWMLSHLKQCKVMVDENGVTRFLKTYNTWADTDIEISLVRETEGLAWNVFRKATNDNFFIDFQKTTIPSLQCHPKTIELIEKIKTEAFNNKKLLDSLITDFKVHVIHFEELKEKLNEARKKNLMDQESYWLLYTPKPKDLYPYLVAGSTLAFRKAIISAAKATSQFFGGSVLGAAAGFYAGVCTFSLVANVFPSISLVKDLCYFVMPEALCKKQETLQKTSLPPLQGDLIEIEPISAPSRIDERIHVSKFIWAVTIITHTGCFGNHAQLVVEGINDGFYSNETPLTTNGKTIKNGEKFTYMAEFNPPIKSQLILPEEEMPFETRSETWIRTSDDIKKMIEDIEQEKCLPKENRRIFNALGRGSKLYRINIKTLSKVSKVGDNCFDFVREKVEIIGITLNKSSFEPIFTLAKCHTLEGKMCRELPVANLI